MAEPAKIEQIIVEFFAKCAQAILESRIVSFSRAASASASASACSSSSSSSPLSSPPRSRDKWFNLNLGLADNAMFPSTEPWSRTLTAEPMFVEIILSDVASALRPIGQRCSVGSVLLERWAVHYAQNPPSLRRADVEMPVVYKKAVILLRSLYSMARILPAYRIYRELKKSPQRCNSRRLLYRISPKSEPVPTGRMQAYNFTPVETQCGKLCLSVHYLQASLTRADGVGFDRSGSPIGAQIIPDYCVSRGRGDISSAPTSPGYRIGGIGRCHSWSGSINKIATQQSPLHRVSSNLTYHAPRTSFRTPPLPMPPSQQRYQGNVDSPSPSPPMLSRLSNENVCRELFRTESLPVGASPSSGGRSLQNAGAEYCGQSKSPLSHHGNRSRNPNAIYRVASANSRLMNAYASGSLGSPPLSGKLVNPRPSGVQSNVQAYSVEKDEKDEIESPSGAKILRSGSSRFTISRSSSRNSYNYEIEDEDLHCPFALDDDESDGYRSRAESVDGKGNVLDVMEVTGETGSTVSTSRRSHNAAVGALVEMLKSAPPLQQNYENSSDFLRSNSWREPSQCQNIAKEHEAASSSSAYFTSSRKMASDALRELKNYKETRDSLLRQRGIPEGKML